MNPTGAQILLRRLQQHGVETLFGYPGGAILPVYEALRAATAAGEPLRHVLVRHEQAAVFAAEGYARATGRLGVAIATSGPGATNLVTGIANAMADSTPLLLVTGQVPTWALGTEAFQEVDVVRTVDTMTKWAVQVREVADLPAILDEAIRRATSGRPGPVLVDLPKDVQTAAWGGPLPPIPSRTSRLGATPGPFAWRDEALRRLRRAERPLLFTGGGIRAADAHEPLRAFAERRRLPQVHSLLGLGNAAVDDPLALGMVGVFGTPAANEAVARCDLLLAMGVRFDDRATGDASTFAPGAEVIHIDIDPRQLGRRRPADLAIEADLGSIWPALSDAPACPPDWERWCRDRATSTRDFVASEDTEGYLWLRALAHVMPPETIVSCDVGNHQMWAARCLRFAAPRRHLTSGGLGAMGFGLPAAIGAQIGQPEATVVAVTGDGSFLMNVQELATVRRYGLPLKIVLLDNGSLGMVRQQQRTLYGGSSENDLSDNPDFVELARAFGIPAWTVQSSESAEEPLRRLLAARGPALLQVCMRGADEVWPWVPRYGAVHPMDHRNAMGRVVTGTLAPAGHPRTHERA